MDHQYCLYETLLHVPLLIKPTDQNIKAKRTDLIELRDLYPTVLEIAGLDVNGGSSVSTNSLLGSNTDRSAVIAEYFEPQPSVNALEQYVGHSVEMGQYDRALRSIRTERWKYIEGTDGCESLYDHRQDPEEHVDCNDQYPEVTNRLAERLSDDHGPLIRNPGDGTTAIDSSTKARLEELGYLQ